MLRKKNLFSVIVMAVILMVNYVSAALAGSPVGPNACDYNPEYFLFRNINGSNPFWWNSDDANLGQLPGIYGENDTVSSVKTYKVKIRLWQHANYEGDSITIGPDTYIANLGVTFPGWNDKASSIDVVQCYRAVG